MQSNHLSRHARQVLTVTQGKALLQGPVTLLGFPNGCHYRERLERWSERHALQVVMGAAVAQLDRARKAGERVRETGRAVQLEPMTALERRWVHMELQGAPGIATESAGEEPERRVVVIPA